MELTLARCDNCNKSLVDFNEMSASEFLIFCSKSCARYFLNKDDRKRRIAIDFDGVLHKYSNGWQNGAIYDEPVYGAVEAMKQLVKEYEVIILTARNEFTSIHNWLEQNGFPRVQVTNIKPPAWLYIDDKALRFNNWKECLMKIEDNLLEP